jgi:hypothetical protein
MNACRLGPITVGLSGSGPVLPFLQREFASQPSTAADRADLQIEFVPDLPPLGSHVHVAPLRVGAERYEVEQGRLRYQVASVKGGLHVMVHTLPLRGRGRIVPPWVSRLRDWNYLLPHEQVAKSFMYNVFDHLSQIALLESASSYIHASSMEKDGSAVALLAWGGVGKTSSMLKLVLEHGWRYLSDDLGLIGADGKVWATPKHLQVYGYNVAGQLHLRARLLAGRSPADRLAWEFRLRRRGPRAVRRRVSPTQLLGVERVAQSGQLRAAAFLERSTVRVPRLRSLSRDDLVRRAVSVLSSELDPYARLAAAMFSASHHPILPDATSLRRRTSEVLERAFSDVEPVLVEVPLRADPNELAEFLSSFLRW